MEILILGVLFTLAVIFYFSILRSFSKEEQSEVKKLFN